MSTQPMTASRKKQSLALVRELVRTYQAFEKMSSNRIRGHGLTHPQFDVIATLGNTAGMNCKELSERTLITKGTLTGVLDRLIDKGLLTRVVDEHDRRSLFVRLTAEGEQVFDTTFDDVSSHCSSAFDSMNDPKMVQLTHDLAHLHALIRKKMEP